MKRMNKPFFSRISIIVGVVLLGLAALVTPASNAMAKGSLAPVRTVVEFGGQVTAVGGPTDAPTALYVMNRTGKTVIFKVRLSTVLKPLSAEAEVEGLVPGDYVDLMAFRLKGAWIATRIQFDVEPIVLVRQVTVTGTVTSERADGRRLWMKLDTGEVRAVAILAKTVWQIDGLPAGGSMMLSRGELVQVKMRRTATNNGWYALTINLMVTTG